MPRFVVLHHVLSSAGTGDEHFDLMLENGQTLATWQLPVWPPERRQTVQRLPEHRRMYLEYEGPVSGDRGTVRRVCCGEFETLSRDDRHWALKLVAGDFHLSVKLDRREPVADQCWTLSLDSATTRSARSAPSGPDSG